MKGFWGIQSFSNNLDFSFIESLTCDVVYTDKNLIINKSSNLVNFLQNENLLYIGWVRIDNRIELFEKLNLESNITDDQLILESYISWGEDFLKYLVGDFCFYIFNKKTNLSLIVKDQMGIRPIFYLVYDDRLYFATSIPLLKLILNEKLLLNIEYIAKGISFYPQNQEDTFFEDIKRLPPAHYLRIENNFKFQKIRYWELKVDSVLIKKFENFDKSFLLQLVEESIKARTFGNQKIGAQLSGGIDSSAIISILSKTVDKNDLSTYSFVLDEDSKKCSESGIDEKSTQRELIDFLNLRNTNHFEIGKHDFKDAFEELNKRNDIMGGYSVIDCIWQDSIFKIAKSKNNVNVMFSGFPGDEGISTNGNNYFWEYFSLSKFPKLIHYLIHYRGRALKNILSYANNIVTCNFFKSFNLVLSNRSLLSNSSSYFNLFKPRLYQNRSFKNHMIARLTSESVSYRMESEILYSMQYDIEMVYPFADIRILEFLLNSPVEIFSPRKYSRQLFRDMTESHLPDSIRLQQKNNGAFALAFAEYYFNSKNFDLKNYLIKNHLGILVNELEFENKKMDSSLIKMKRNVDRKEIDYLIDININ